ncbi:protein RETARDED ROOT GROWTH, mitochondrial isoform X1 [Salvia hispanica]|uniref:protein RETARDED ROOT GROWTH, mitochondrial isoform X1 n=1 Tax=Salvia hispanica TaxID=49212 RepID=UPI002009CF71|nr:protein RETARDED ROOT GROWTH, mitochondrial isoform X1 [Salvia hispanica]
MGRWGWRVYVAVSRIASASKSINNPNLSRHPLIRSQNSPLISRPRNYFSSFRHFSALPASPPYVEEFDSRNNDFDANKILEELFEDDEAGNISVRAFFLCTSVDLKSMQAENSKHVIPPTSRSSNSIILRFCGPPWETCFCQRGAAGNDMRCYRYMVVYQYGSTILFNVEDHEVDFYLQTVRQHASGLLTEMRKDDYAIKEKPLLVEDMQGGLNHIVLKNLDMDSIRIIGSVLGQSIALDYFVSQVDGMVEEFAQINRAMQKTGTFTMDRKKLFQLVGKANSNLADVILKVGIFDRSEIAWRDAKYAQILDYLREEYEVAQRFGNLDFKLKFVEHNIHFLQEVLQNRKSDLLEWCIIILLAIENIISICEIVRDSIGS